MKLLWALVVLWAMLVGAKGHDTMYHLGQHNTEIVDYAGQKSQLCYNKNMGHNKRRRIW